MAMTGPQRYPGASTAAWYQGTYGGDLMEVNVVVLHTTEGRTLPDYRGGADAPNLTAVPDFGAKKLKWYQHFDIDRSSRALVNLAGGVETNTLNACQVELVGTCDSATHRKWAAAGAPHIYWPEAPDWALAEVAAFLRWMHANHGVPLSGPARWPAYPGSYGSAGGQRMTGAQWEAFNGVCGHMHVPENVHGDPGAIDFTKLIALAKGGTTPTEEDVALTTDEVTRIADAVFAKFAAAGGVLEDGDLDRIWKRDVIPAATPPFNNSDYFAADGKTVANDTWSATYTQYTQVMGIRETLAIVKELRTTAGAVQLTVAQVATIAAQVASSTNLVDQIAEKVAEKLAARLAE